MQKEEDAKAEALASRQKGWSLEDEDDEEDEAQPAQPQDLEEGGDEIDPLDAFMMENEATAKQEIEVDPHCVCYWPISVTLASTYNRLDGASFVHSSCTCTSSDCTD